MAAECNKKHPLSHNGTSQDQRFPEALEPGSVKIHDFSLRDWMRFAWYFAGHLNYYSLENETIPEGNWQAFMKSEAEIEEFLKDAALVDGETWIPDSERKKIINREPGRDYEPHLALFLAFLKLMDFPRTQLNDFSRRHLAFYYNLVLKLSRRAAVPDRVHILFELAKNASDELVSPDAVLLAGKDKNGKPLKYYTTGEVNVSPGRVTAIKSAFHRKGDFIKYAGQTDSADGTGTPFAEENSAWQPFGNTIWPGANVGFALASGVLLMKEGNRMVDITLTLDIPEGFTRPSMDQLAGAMKLFITGEENWIQLSPDTSRKDPEPALNRLFFSFTVSTSEKAVVPYDPLLHGEKFNTNLPVLRVLLDAGTSDGYAVCKALAGTIITHADIKVSVTGAKNLVVENDNGKLDPSKPFYPFGTQPGKKSAFYIGSSEVFGKKWTFVKLNVDWKNKPASLKNQYQCYTSALLSGQKNSYDITTTPSDSELEVTGDSYFTVLVQYIRDNKWYPAGGRKLELFTNPLTINPEPVESAEITMSGIQELMFSKEVDVNKNVVLNYLKSSPKAKVTESGGDLIRQGFDISVFDPGFPLLPVTTLPFSAGTDSDYLKLTLENSFLHEYYPRLFTMATIALAGGSGVILPLEPYIPMVSSLTLDYEASESNDFAISGLEPQEKLDHYAARRIQLFHEHPFGQCEQHLFLKEQCDFLPPDELKQISLMPVFSPEGELYLGLQNARSSSIINILFQVAEGSEDPLAPAFDPDEKIEWFGLCNNEWKPLNKAYISGNTTNNLLRPGIIRFLLPSAMNNTNTLLGDQLFWLMARLPAGKHHSSVCRITGIFAQAEETLFTDQGNELSHLASALPAGTITKMENKPGNIKKVVQPYPSFGGRPAEDEKAFNLRVSERLRHKQRAVNIRDYECLVLGQFPSVYKVKCLSHTFTPDAGVTPAYSEFSPGDVSLVVIPDIRNLNSYDPLHPRASRNLLTEIREFICQLNALPVRFNAVNPHYETVLLDFRVKFHDTCDPNTYQKTLNDDLVRYLSPWAFGDYSAIHFGGTLYKSVIIRFIEKRPYVDFVSRVHMYHLREEDDLNRDDLSAITASYAHTILVSAQQHEIQSIEKEKVCDE